MRQVGYLLESVPMFAPTIHARYAVLECTLQISLIVIRAREKAKADAGFALPQRRCEPGK